MSKVALIVGSSNALIESMDELIAADSMCVILTPVEAADPRNLEILPKMRAVREIIEYNYLLPGAADAFYLRNRDLQVVAVVPAKEAAVLAAARLAERFGVPGASFGAASILRDKHQQRRVAASVGLANPRSELVNSADDIRAFASKVDGPIIIKPRRRDGSAGTYIVRDRAQLETVLVSVDEYRDELGSDDGRSTELPTDRAAAAAEYLVEEFITGDEFSVEVLVRKGRACFANVTAKRLYPGPRPIELGHVVPAPIGPELTNRLVQATERFADAVAFDTGVLHCEWIVSGDRPYLVECAGRLPGDRITHLIALAWSFEFSLHYWLIMHGENPPAMPKAAELCAATHFLSADPGTVTSVEGLAEAKAAPWVVFVDCEIRPGDRVSPLRSSLDRIGSVVAIGPTADIALASAKAGSEMIRVRVG